MTSEFATSNRRVVLAARPTDFPSLDCFRLESGPVPVCGDGEVLLRTMWLSLDPYMRGRMNDAPSYKPPIALGETMVGGTIARVVESHLADFAAGDWVLSANGWQDFAVSNGHDLIKLAHGSAQPSWSLGVMGMPGYTAYTGLHQIGQPIAGETVVVSAATGAVGSVVGQLAKQRGCRIVGIAGGAEKCDWAIRGLGFDACVDHRSPKLMEHLHLACPSGVDVYFENVGGKVLAAVLPLLNVGARVPICGLMSLYNQTEPYPDISAQLLVTLLRKRVLMRGFIIYDHDAGFRDFQVMMQGLVQAEIVRYREDIVVGLDQAPKAFLGMLRGHNFGKTVVDVAGTSWMEPRDSREESVREEASL